MKKVMITLTFVLQFVETCLGIVGEIFVSLVEIKGIIVSKTFWLAVFYQPFIMFFVIILFLNKIDEFTKTWFEGGRYFFINNCIFNRLTACCIIFECTY